MGKISVIPANHLKEKATKRLALNAAQMEDWVNITAENLTHWADEDAAKGQLRSVIKKEDFSTILPTNFPQDPSKIYTVLTRTKDLLEKTYGYKVVLDNYNPTTKYQDVIISSITLDWSIPFNPGMEMPK